MKPDSKLVQVALMRHARTVWNEEQRVQGWLDSPLSKGGCRQAGQWAETLAVGSFDRIICSDLGRSRETARIINSKLGLSVVADQRYRERCFGNLEGRDNSCLESVRGDDRPEGGEIVADVRERAMSALMELGKHAGERILLVSHHGVLQAVLTCLAGPDYPLHEGRLFKSRRMHWVGVNKRHMGIISLNARIKS